MSVAPMTSPFRVADVMEMARRVLQARWTGETGRLLLREWRGCFWEWFAGSRWMKRDVEWVKDQVILELEGCYVMEGQAIAPMQTPSGTQVNDVVRAIMAITRLENVEVPCWLDGEGVDRPDPKYCVGFRNVVVDIKGTVEAMRELRPVLGTVANGQFVGIPWKTIPRDESWFDVYTVPCDWDPEALCPRWSRCLEEWFGGDEASKELAARVFGYGMLSTRKYGRAPLLIGKIRGGKGVFVRRWKKMLGAGFHGTSMSHLVTGFGLNGTQHARVVSVGEVHGLERNSGEVFSSIWKNWVGGDEITVNMKYAQPVTGVMRALPVMSSNEMPMLPNKGAGMSGKLLILPFDNSFLGREQFDLEEELDGETAGIARWAMMGAVRLEFEESGARKWPVSERADEVLRTYRLMNNPMDGFLEARFERAAEGFAASRVVHGQWRSWLRETGMRLSVPLNQLLLRIEQESTWGVYRYREAGGGERGLKGLAVRRESDDEV